MKATTAVLTAGIVAAAAYALDRWGAHYVTRRFVDGIKPSTGDSAVTDVWDEGMEMARSAGSGTEWVFRGVNP